jgi:AcrR family transcriptional regulator
MSAQKEMERQSFIAEARRRQIIEAAVETLDEIGFVNASLAQIAKRAGISTALISYHFKDKQDLMDHTLMVLIERATSYVMERTNAQTTAREKLHAYIEASLAYQGTHPKHNTALIEIVFNARTAENIPYYKLSDEEEEPLTFELQQILRDGQANGEFREFNVQVMAIAIRGAIGEYLVNPNISPDVDLELHSAELATIFDRAIYPSNSA